MLIELVEDLAANEINNNRHSTYKKLLELIDRSKSNYAQSGARISRSKADDVLNNFEWMMDSVKVRVDKFIAYYQHQQKQGDSETELLNKILLYGPPGSGKTTLGFYISSRLGKPINYVKITDVISSKLGETMRNISDLFESTSDSIIFIDEFDALAKSREEGNDVGELKRIVNSLIQTLDFQANGRIIIVATNLIDTIDPAILRRFSYKVYVGALNTQEKQSFLEYKLLGVNNSLSKKDITFLVKIFDFLQINTIDDIDVFFKKVKMNMMFEHIQKLDLANFIEVVFMEDYMARPKDLKKENINLLSKLCKMLESNGYSKSGISNLLNIHRNSYKNYVLSE